MAAQADEGYAPILCRVQRRKAAALMTDGQHARGETFKRDRGQARSRQAAELAALPSQVAGSAVGQAICSTE